MNDRPLLLVVYGVMLGWMLREWWEAERSSIICKAKWEAVETCSEFAAPPRAAPEPASSPAA